MLGGNCFAEMRMLGKIVHKNISVREIHTKTLMNFHEDLKPYETPPTAVQMWRTGLRTGKTSNWKSQNWQIDPSLTTQIL